MLNFKTTKQFERDYRLMVRQGKNIGRLKGVMNTLVNQKPLKSRHREHALTGNWKGHRDCHVEPDWILIYRVDKEAQEIIFTRTGSHTELFG